MVARPAQLRLEAGTKPQRWHLTTGAWRFRLIALHLSAGFPSQKPPRDPTEIMMGGFAFEAGKEVEISSAGPLIAAPGT